MGSWGPCARIYHGHKVLPAPHHMPLFPLLVLALGCPFITVAGSQVLHLSISSTHRPLWTTLSKRLSFHTHLRSLIYLAFSYQNLKLSFLVVCSPFWKMSSVKGRPGLSCSVLHV